MVFLEICSPSIHPASSVDLRKSVFGTLAAYQSDKFATEKGQSILGMKNCLTGDLHKPLLSQDHEKNLVAQFFKLCLDGSPSYRSQVWLGEIEAIELLPWKPP
jgi:hypothetical protein